MVCDLLVLIDGMRNTARNFFFFGIFYLFWIDLGDASNSGFLFLIFEFG